MNIPEEFGKYLLLKKLTEDPLGETFRAGRVGKDGGMEQVVLLRVFNGKGIDGEKLWARVSGRSAVQEILKSPNIGNGVDLGRVRSFPYTAYDYISGKSLATVFAQAARQHSPVPTDHALLIAERLALALAAAYESRVQDERVLHGFVVPQLVMISNEGETRLLGFEVAPGLRDLAAAGWQDDALRPYLAPETLSGAATTRADDVYSLGAILYELLTGERLPAATAEGYGAVIDAAQLPNEGTALPAPIAALLKKSLVPREQRIADAVTWHKTLSKLMIDSSFSPTTFNLAFFMHSLFRDEIERESQEVQAEKRLELPQRTTAVLPVMKPAAAAPEPREATAVREGTLSGTRAQAGNVPPASKKGLWIGLAALLLAALAAGGYFLFGRGPAPAPVAAAAPAVPAPVPAAAGTTATPTPEELQAQIQKMFDERSKDMEDKFKGQYDDRIKQLQKQLDDSRKAAAAGQPAKPAPAEPAPAETRIAQKPEPAVEAPPPAAVPQPAGSAAQTAPVTEKPVPAPAPVNPAPIQPAAPKAQQVQVGDLVQAGEGVALPKLASSLDLRYPPAAKHLNRAASVDVKVLVDEHGKVLDADHIGAKAGFGFDEAAVDAVRRATFKPATKENVKVKMWTTVRVNFKPM
ncbi:MAG TPA: TonB family protein [Thermoanaerobaculia bacterium]|nr:TonB family protein [Thermoanaerobaculia bacterium]